MRVDDTHISTFVSTQAYYRYCACDTEFTASTLEVYCLLFVTESGRPANGELPFRTRESQMRVQRAPNGDASETVERDVVSQYC